MRVEAVVPSRRPVRGAAGAETNRMLAIVEVKDRARVRARARARVVITLLYSWRTKAYLVLQKYFGLAFPPLPPGEGCWRLSGASGASGVRARVASHGHARRKEEPSDSAWFVRSGRAGGKARDLGDSAGVVLFGEAAGTKRSRKSFHHSEPGRSLACPPPTRSGRQADTATSNSRLSFRSVARNPGAWVAPQRHSAAHPPRFLAQPALSERSESNGLRNDTPTPGVVSPHPRQCRSLTWTTHHEPMNHEL
jgi:hypothetical protein